MSKEFPFSLKPNSAKAESTSCDTSSGHCRCSDIESVCAKRCRVDLFLPFRGEVSHRKVPTRVSTPWLIFLFAVAMFFSSSNATANTPKYAPDERQILRKLFLKRFGLDQLVSVTPPSNMQLPEYIWDLYDQAEDEELDLIRHYYPIVVEEYNVSNRSGYLLRYNLSATGRDPSAERLLSADLRLKADSGADRMRVNVFTVDNTTVPTQRLTESEPKKLRIGDNQWLDYDVSEALNQANNRLADVVEIILENTSTTSVSELKTSAALVTICESANDNENNKRRQKRSVRSGGGRKHRKHRKHHITPKDTSQCRRTELYVDFAELNWQDWIMAPVGYDAYQCQGQCPHPLPSHLNTTNHAIIQSLINSIDPGAVPPPSCVPVEMSAISILYRDINNVVVVKTYPDMKVESCGCH